MQNAQIIHKQYILEKNIIYIFLFLLLFEGAIRKWIFPSLATPLLIIKRPFCPTSCHPRLKKRIDKPPYCKNLFFYQFYSFTDFVNIP